MKRLAPPILLFLTSFFPFWWTAASVVRSGPAIVETAVSGRELTLVRAGFGGVQAVAAAEGSPRGRRGRVDWLAPAVGMAVLVLLGRWPAAGLFVACLGFAAAQNSVMGLLFGGLVGNGWRAAVFVASLALWLAGLRTMLAAVDEPGRWERLLLLAMGFGVPVALIQGWRPPFLIATAIAVLAAAVLPARKGARPPGRRSIAFAICVSAALAVGLYASQQARRTAQQLADAHRVPAARTLFFQRGVNLTAEFPDGYDSQRLGGLLDELKRYGVDAVALVPYGFSAPGSGAVQYGGGNTMEGDDGVAYTAALAHQRGMKVFLKPQIWAGRSFPGDLDYPEPASRAQWFAAYGGFVDHYAALAMRVHADLFAVGVEFGKLSKYEAEWRELVARARRKYSGPVTYAANFGPEFEGIRFWDAVDYIGLNNYYPLPDDLRTDEVVAKVEAVQKRFGKPVIFPEAGFPSVEGGNREPWAEPRRPLSHEAQARSYEALFLGFYKQPWFQGMYWWKVGTNGFGGMQDGSHTPWRKPAMDVVGRWYRDGGR